MTTAKKIEVMQAFLDGKKIEFFDFTFHQLGWVEWSMGEPVWDWLKHKYRVKKEPKEFLIAYHEDTGKFVGLAESPSNVVTILPVDFKLGTIKVMQVREVLE